MDTVHTPPGQPLGDARAAAAARPCGARAGDDHPPQPSDTLTDALDELLPTVCTRAGAANDAIVVSPDDLPACTLERRRAAEERLARAALVMPELFPEGRRLAAARASLAAAQSDLDAAMRDWNRLIGPALDAAHDARPPRTSWPA